ncbi:PTS system fructose subfamily IIA component [Ferriphaselus amnicola]|uniref:PTS system fructose subfamily IIA component n=1 Tax=Ferriphaselus amnicola TaxID=1188319 RepID=A0A2Z6G894_9PROT|nr:PTS sugar transporter subunit IIA [Ferriphaselus amnicola]BBE49603.1 PTS system fructose subfamily IIA component [Ferriphaselus amnicola]
MVGILLVTHNGLGNSLLDCVRHVLRTLPPHLRSLSVQEDDDPSQKEAEGRALIAELDQGDGVLILTDMFGATPSNIGRRLCLSDRVMGVAGVNLPMLLRISCCCDKPLGEMAQRALEGGRECIVYMDSENHHVATGCLDH